MKDLVVKPENVKNIEFWAATTIFVFAIFFHVSGAINNQHAPNQNYFEEANLTFYYYQNYFIPQLIKFIFFYLAFLLLNFKVAPDLIKKTNIYINVFLIFLVFLVLGLVYGVTNTYYKNYLFSQYYSEDETYRLIFQKSYIYAFWLICLFGFYSLIKYAGIYIITNSQAIQSKYQIITRDGLIAFVLWMVSMFILLLAEAEGGLILGWGIVGPSGIIFYLFSFHSLIPVANRKKKPFLAFTLRAILVLVVSAFPIFLFGFLLLHDEETAAGISIFNVFVQLFITMPLSWVLYKKQLKGNQEIHSLKTELGHTNANFDFLRSQINPHFLFNALNTLYGTALQENSERTAQGIQMLGDMMRFMLHENHQHKILLSREIEYMRNFIQLQALRTSHSPDINIQTKIEDVMSEKFISPMLLIPFIENAFKHGISLKHKSWIKISLYTEPEKLYFDVYNSTHPKKDQDPEKDKSGIGLENVKQRLALMYPKKHELVIRETVEEYFVHLTLQL